MGVVTVSSSASQTPIGLSSRFSTNHSTFKIPTILNFKTDKTENTSLATTHESNPLTPKTHGANKRLRKPTKSSKRVKVVATDDACVLDLDYTEAAAKLENIYKLSPAKDISDVEDIVRVVRRRRRTKKVEKRNEKVEKKPSDVVVRSDNKKVKRLGLDKRIALKRTGEVINTSKKKKEKLGDGDIDRLVRDYSASTDLVSLDWKKIKIPPVLPSLEHTWLFKLMQPMKVLLEVKEAMCRDLGRESSDGELATATNMNIPQVRRQIEVRRAARNKLIKHNLRLVLFVINKYFQEFANSTRFQDLCQAGARGLITAIDHFEPKRSFRLSTYADDNVVVPSTTLLSPDDVYSTTLDPNYCKSVLPTTGKQNICYYCRSAITQSLQDARKFSALVDKYLKKHSTLSDGAAVQALQDCRLMAKLNIGFLQSSSSTINATQSLRNAQVDDLRTLLSAILKNQQSFLYGLEDTTSSSTIRDEFYASLFNGSELYSVSLALFSHGWENSISHGRHGRDWRHQKYRNHWRHWRHERHWRQLKMTVVEI